jgi:hypothetical protein
MSDQPQGAFSTTFKEQVVLRIQAGERLALWGQDTHCFISARKLRYVYLVPVKPNHHRPDDAQI